MSEPKSVQDSVRTFLTEPQVLHSEELRDGVTRILVGSHVGPVFEVKLQTPDGTRTVFTTSYADEAMAVYEAVDGKEPGWHRSYPARGASWPKPDDLAFTVFAVGKTAEECAAAFLDRMGQTLTPGTLVQLEQSTDKKLQWGCSFSSLEEGTEMYLGGVRVPGGLVATYWN